MKTVFISSLVFFLILTGYTQDVENWQILNEGRFINAIDFVNDEVGWISTRDGIEKTENGGETWQDFPLPGNYNIEKFDFLDEMIGYAIIFEDTSGYGIIKTLDGGMTWSAPEVFNGDIINELDVVEENCVYAVGSNSYDSDVFRGFIWKTSDGGANWHDISPDLTNKIAKQVSFANSELGLISVRHSNDEFTSFLFRSVDGGTHWDEYLFSNHDIFYLQFVNDSTAYMLARNDTSDYFLYTTTDSGKTWDIILQTTNENRIISFSPSDGQTFFIAMSDTASVNILKSTDGGKNWTKTYSYAGFSPDLLFTSSNTGYIQSQPGRGRYFLMRTNDGGVTWQTKRLSYPFKGVSFLSSQNGIAFGGYYVWHLQYPGDIFITIDGGYTWNLAYHFRDGWPGSSFFLDSNTGFLTTGSKIYRTTDGGYDWNKVFDNEEDDSTTSCGGNDISFKNDLEGWVAGGYYEGNSGSEGAALLGTIDGGNNWDIIWKGNCGDDSRCFLNSIYFYNTTGWAVGEQGMMVKYTEQDQWQIQTSPTDLPLNKVFFSDENHGWIAGGYLNDQNFQSIILKTSDAGITWYETRFDKYLINDLYFCDSLHGFAVGNDTANTGQLYPGHGVILETIDGGESWNPTVENLSSQLTAIHFKDGVGWAVGYNGLILRTDNWVDWINPNTGEKYPTKYKLMQNYPNPFNPVTVISWQLAVSGQVDLSIYNLLGQKVCTLVSENQKTGNHKIEWNASGLSSGVYLYRLKAGNHVQTKKMIFMK